MLRLDDLEELLEGYDVLYNITKHIDKSTSPQKLANVNFLLTQNLHNVQLFGFEKTLEIVSRYARIQEAVQFLRDRFTESQQRKCYVLPIKSIEVEATLT